jgi:hypothetical protein
MHLFIVRIKHKMRLQFFSCFTHFHSIFFLHIFLLNTLLLLLVLMVRENFKVRHARVHWSNEEVSVKYHNPMINRYGNDCIPIGL